MRVTALMGLDARLRLARLLVVTDTRNTAVEFRDHVVALFQSGADIVQVRDPGKPEQQIMTALEVARSAPLQLNKLVAVSGDVALAGKFGADVIVVPASADASAVHAQVHEWALVGQGIHSQRDLVAAGAAPATNFALVGPVFVGAGAPVAAPGPELLHAAAELLPVADPAGTPWFAAGGIGPANLDQVLATGARRVAITVGGDQSAVGPIADRLRDAWNSDNALRDFAFGVFGRTSPPATFRGSQTPSPW